MGINSLERENHLPLMIPRFGQPIKKQEFAGGTTGKGL
jgi:hypothetical protein